MLYRDQASLVFALVSPVLLIGILGLFQNLRLDVGGASGAIEFYDFVVPGLAAFWIVYFSVYGMSAAAAGYRAEGILKRIAASPATPGQFIGAQILARLVIGMGQASLILAVGAALGASLQVGPTLAWLLPLIAAGTLLGLTIGFAIVGLTKTTEGAASFASLLVMPLWVLSGVMYPLGSLLPEAVEEAVRYLPTTPLIDAARAISLKGIGIGDLGFEFSVLAGWLLAFFMIASRTFRFSDR
jgi:ABC-2 type transport system permease protein